MATSNDLNISQSGYVSFDGTATFSGRTFQAGTGITLTNPDGISGNTTITANGANDLHTAKFIVSSEGTTGTGANFTNITAAIAAAQGTGLKSTIFIMPGLTGTYTENFTLPANINLTSFACDPLTPTVTIIGNITCSSAGSRSISNIRLQTNSAALLTVSGSAATVVNLNNCYINCTNNTGITFSSSSSSATINISNCLGDLGTTGIALFSHSSAGTLGISYSGFNNSGGSSTANTISSGTLVVNYSAFANPLTTSSTAIASAIYSSWDTSAQNVISITSGGSGAHQFQQCRFSSGSASAITISNTLGLIQSQVTSSNTNAITGAGTLNYGFIDFITSNVINTTTQSETNAGTFSPTMTGASTAGTTTYTVQSGNYTRVGNRCFFDLHVAWSGATGTGQITIGGLPFASTSTTTSSFYPVFSSGIFLTAGNIPISTMSSSASTFTIGQYAIATGSATAVNVIGAGSIYITGHYTI